MNWLHIIKGALVSLLVDHYGGLLPHVEDERDFKFSDVFGIASYQPKHTTWELPVISIKNQEAFNTCVWNSATAQKEAQEGVPLSVKYFVAAARKKGLLWGNGYAYLRSAQQLLCDTGVCEEAMLPDVKTSWDSYSDPAQVTYDRSINAAAHRSTRYFLVKTKDDFLKALDDGYSIQTGLTWFTGYRKENLAGDFTLKIGSGSAIGGHAVRCIGYNITKGTLKFQNSFGPDWGDRGCFYVKMSDWFRMGSAGYVTVDIDNSQIIASYNGKDVKGDGPAIYRIEGGKKRVYPNEATFYKYGGKFGANKTWVAISNSLLNSIPVGDPMV